MYLVSRRCNKRFKKNVQGISQSAIDLLSAYDWPGNIRELENLIERLVAIMDGDTVLREHIPLEYTLTEFQDQKKSEGLFEKAKETFERNFLLKTLEKERWNRRATAQLLGIPLSTLKYKLKRLKLQEQLSNRRKT